MNFKNFEFPKPMIPTPSIIDFPDPKALQITNPIDNLKNVNRLRDMDNLFYQIKIKERQIKLYNKRLNSINSTLDIKVGRVLSILIIIFSIIIPFLYVSIEQVYSKFATFIFVYMIVTFILSMGSMVIYLFCLWKNK